MLNLPGTPPGPGNHNRISPLGSKGQPMPGMPSGQPMPGPGGPPIDPTHYEKIKCPECGSEALSATMSVVVQKKISMIFQGPEILLGMIPPQTGPNAPMLVMCLKCGITIDAAGKKVADITIDEVEPENGRGGSPTRPEDCEDAHDTDVEGPEGK